MPTLTLSTHKLIRFSDLLVRSYFHEFHFQLHMAQEEAYF